MRADVLVITAAAGEDEAVRAVSKRAAPAGWTKCNDKPPNFLYPLWECVFERVSGRRPMRVILARTPDQRGVATAGIAGPLISHFQPSCVAMCGVCAGRPGEVNLGDVIIADKVWYYDQGAVMRRAGEEQEFWHEMETYQLPKHWKLAAESFICELPPNAAWLAERPTPDNGKPWEIRVGPIATGSDLVQDPTYWDDLAKTQNRKTLGIEMEAAAIGWLAAAFDVRRQIVVKAAMDFGDPAKSNKCRAFAAHAAAEVLIGFLVENLEADDQHGDSDFVVSTSEYYRDELAQHRHAYVARGLGGASSEVLEEVNRWVAQPAGTFLIVSAPGGSGKSRLCVEAAKLAPLEWINLKTYRHDVEGLVRGLLTHIKQGRVYVYEDQQEFRTALDRVADVVFKNKARLIILSREQEEPQRAVNNLGGVRVLWLPAASSETLRKILETADSGTNLPPAVRDRIVRISAGTPAVAVLALAHFRACGTLDRIDSVDHLFSSIYDNIRVRAGDRWTTLAPVLGRLGLMRGLPPAEVRTHYEGLRAIMAPGQITGTEREVRLQPDQLSDFIAKKTYFVAGISPDFLAALDEKATSRAREIMTTLVVLDQRGAAGLLVEKGAMLDVQTRIDLAMAAHAGFHDVELIRPLLADLRRDALADADADYCHKAATLLFELSRWGESEELWKRAAELCAQASNGWGESRVQEFLGLCYATQGRTPEAQAAYARALQALEGMDPALTLYGGGLIHTRLGILARSRETWSASIAELDKALGLFGQLAVTSHRTSGLADTYLQAGWTWMAAGNMRNATHCFDEALKYCAELDDPGARASVARCVVLLQAGQFEEAARSFRATEGALIALDDVRLLAEVRIEYANACIRAGRWTDASTHHTAALETSRSLGSKHLEALALTGLGDVAWLSGQPEAAQAPYKLAIAAYGTLGLLRDEALVRHQLAAVLHALNDDAQAFALNERALQELERIDDRQGQSDVLVSRGSMRADRYEWTEALAAFDAALELWPGTDLTHKRAPILAGQARVFENLGKWREAVATYREALRLNTELEHGRGIADAHACIGSIRRCLGQYEEAIAEYDAAIEHQPHIPDYYANRAEVHYLWDRFEDAERDLTIAGKLDPASSRAVEIRAWMLIRQGHYAEAVRLVDERLATRPTGVELWNIRGYAHIRNGEFAESVADYERAQNLAPRAAVLYATRGRAYGRVRRFEEAERDFATARALRPALRELFWVEYDATAVAALRGAPAKQLVEQLKAAMALPYWDGDCICHSRMIEHLAWDPDFAALRQDARFAVLLDDSPRRQIAASL